MVLLIQFPPVQTWLVGRVTSYLSNKLQTDVEIRSVNISFFNKLVLKGVYVQDLDKDTLLYANYISIGINKLPLFGRPLSVSKVTLSDGQFNLKSDTTGANVSKIVQKIAGKRNQQVQDTAKKAGTFSLIANELELKNFSFSFWKYEEGKVPHDPNSIDFKDIEADSIYLTADNIRIENDTLFYDVKSLSANEKSGYRLRKLTTNAFIVPGKDIHFNNLEVTDDYSHIRLKYYSMTYNGAEEFSNFVENVVLSGDFENSEVSFESIGYFAAALQNIPIKVIANGFVNGPVSNLKSNNLNIKGLNNTVIDGRFSMSGLPDINETFIFADLKQLSTNPQDFFTAISKITGDKMESLDNFLSNVNQVNFKGSFTGLYNDFVANGNLLTNLGSLKLDVLFKSGNNKSIDFSGRVSTPQLDAGKLLKADFIGQTKFNLMTKGHIPPNGSLNLFGEGVISELLLNDYTYKNINLSGTLVDNEFNGSVNVQDPNIDLAFLGKVNFKGTKEDPVPMFDFDADLKHIDLAKLNFNKRDSVSKFEGKIHAKFKGDNITNYIGEIKLLDAFYTDDIERIPIGELSLTSRENNGKSSLFLSSDFIEAEYIGTYLFGQFIKELQHIAYLHAPNLATMQIDSTQLHHFNTQRYEAHIRTKKSGRIARIIVPGLYVAENTTLDLIVDTAHLLKLNVLSKSIILNNNSFKDIRLDAQNSASSLDIAINSSDIAVGGLEFKNIAVNNSIQNNDILTTVSYYNNEAHKGQNKLAIDSKITNNNYSDKNQIGLDINIQPSSIIFNDSVWKFSPSRIIIDSGRIAVNNFKFYNNSQFLNVEGAISKNINDTLKINLNDYDLRGLNHFSQNIGYDITGTVSGKAEITDMYNVPVMMINVNARNITLNNDTLGNVTIASAWDKETERLNLLTRIVNNNEINANINGYISPKDHFMRLDMGLHKLKVEYIEPFLTGIVSDLSGSLSGALLLQAKPNDVSLTGKVKLDETSLLVDYLQTRYVINANIDLEKEQFTITNGSLFDINGQTGKLNVTFNHKNFQNIYFNAQATINNMMCLNTKEKDNPLFYGTSYATGGINIYGTPRDIHFNITAQAERNSTLYIPLSSTAEAKEISMLTFKTADTIKAEDPEFKTDPKAQRPKTHIDFSLDLTVTPVTEIQILIDKKAGDILRAQGQGNLKIDVDPSLNLFNMVGDYQISRGDYNFTLPNFNFISRKFIIDEGSQINFDGDVSDAELNVQASYKTRASITPLVSGLDTASRSTTKKYPIDCQIFITGKMSRPNLKFNIEFPNLDPEAKAEVMSAMNTPEKMTTQFLSLLVMQSFIPEQQYGNTNYGTVSVLNNATEFLSGQIGNLISMLDLPIPVDLNVDVGLDDNQQLNDFEVGVNTQLFDRVLINGSVSNNTRSNRSLVGDIEIEVLLGKQGKYRLKVFTRSSDYFTKDLDYNMQGAGISYQTDFDNFKDLFHGKKRRQKKKNRFLDAINNKDNESL